MKTYHAPWGTALCGSPAILVVLALAAETWWLPGHASGRSLPLVMPGALPLVARSHPISGEAILFRRQFWTTRIELASLSSAGVLKFGQRTVVVSPETPEDFTPELNRR